MNAERESLSALPRTDVLAGALAKLRAATELARGYAPAVVTRAEAHALLDHFASLERHTRFLEDARDKWYVREGKLKQERSRYRQQADRYREENERLRRGGGTCSSSIAGAGRARDPQGDRAMSAEREGTCG